MQSAPYVSPPPGALAIPLRAREGGIKAWAWVDEDDYAWACQYNWHLTDEGYVSRNVPPRESGKSQWSRTLMHRELLELRAGDGLEGDHVNRDRRDNRRSNLRAVSHQQNSHNQKANKRENRSSEYRGVSWHKATGKWWAYARIDGVLKSAGYYRNEEEAAQAAAEFRKRHMTHTTD